MSFSKQQIIHYQYGLTYQQLKKGAHANAHATPFTPASGGKIPEYYGLPVASCALLLLLLRVFVLGFSVFRFFVAIIYAAIAAREALGRFHGRFCHLPVVLYMLLFITRCTACGFLESSWTPI